MPPTIPPPSGYEIWQANLRRGAEKAAVRAARRETMAKAGETATARDARRIAYAPVAAANARVTVARAAYKAADDAWRARIGRDTFAAKCAAGEALEAARREASLALANYKAGASSI